MESSLKFCVDCEHCITFNRDASTYECDSPKNNRPSIDLVTGKHHKIQIFCFKARADSNACGEEAKWWEKRTRSYGAIDNSSGTVVIKQQPKINLKTISADDL